MKFYIFEREEFEEWAEKNPIIKDDNQKDDIDFLDLFYDGEDFELKEGIAKDPRTRLLNNRIDKTKEIINIQKVERAGHFNWEKYELYIYGAIFALEPHKIDQKELNLKGINKKRFKDLIKVVDRQFNPFNTCLGDFETGKVYKEICLDGTVRFGFDFDEEIEIKEETNWIWKIKDIENDFKTKIESIVKIQNWFRKYRFNSIRKTTIMKAYILKSWFESPDNPVTTKLRENWFHKGILCEILC